MIDQGDDQAHEQYYSAGDPSKFAPSPDGKALTSLTGSATGLNASTNALAFLTSLVNAGFPEDKIGNDVSIFDGTVVHVNQVAQPKRAGLKDQKRGKTYLLVTKIVRLPWEAAPASAKPREGRPRRDRPAPCQRAPAAARTCRRSRRPGATPATTAISPPKPATPCSTSSPRRGARSRRRKLPTEAFRTLGSDPDRNAVVTLVFQDGVPRRRRAPRAPSPTTAPRCSLA